MAISTRKARPERSTKTLDTRPTRRPKGSRSSQPENSPDALW